MSNRSKPGHEQVGSLKSFVGNSAGIMLSRGITIAVSFAVVPSLIEALGLSGYGACETMLAFAAACNLLQSMIGGVVLRQASELLGNGESEAAAGLVQKGISLVLGAAIVVVPTTYVLRGRVVHLLGIPTALQHEASTALTFIVGIAMLAVSNDVLAAFVGAHQKSGISSLLQSIGVVGGNLVLIACATRGLGFFSIPVGTAAGWILGFTLLFIVGRRHNPALSLRPVFEFSSMPLGTRRYALFLLFGTVSILSRDVADKLLMSATGSPEWAGYFGIAARLTVPVTMACTFFYIPTIAATAALFARDDWDKINQLFRRTSFVIATAAGSLGLFIYAMHRPLITLWIGRDVSEVSPLLAWLLFGNVTAIILSGASSSVCKGIRHLKPEIMFIVITLVLNIILKWFLIRRFGPLGSASASALSWSFSSLIFAYLVARANKLSIIPLRFAVWACVAFVLILCLLHCVSSGFVVIMEGDGLGRWIVSSLIAFGAVFIYLIALVVAGAKSPSRILFEWKNKDA